MIMIIYAQITLYLLYYMFVYRVLAFERRTNEKAWNEWNEEGPCDDGDEVIKIGFNSHLLRANIQTHTHICSTF